MCWQNGLVIWFTNRPTRPYTRYENDSHQLSELMVRRLKYAMENLLGDNTSLYSFFFNKTAEAFEVKLSTLSVQATYSSFSNT